MMPVGIEVYANLLDFVRLDPAVQITEIRQASNRAVGFQLRRCSWGLIRWNHIMR